jgi:cation diffusion facilitator CzcD-associated flavoprotein CzcO
MLFTPQKEIRSYLRQVSDKYGVTSHILFRTSFMAAAWNEESNDWSLTLEDLSTDTIYYESVEILILAIRGPWCPKLPWSNISFIELAS